MRLLDKITARKIRDGDIPTFETLVNKYKNKVLNYCIRVVNNYHYAEELTQEVFLKVYKNIDTYDWQKASLATWIYTIAHNTCINSLRNSHHEVPLNQISVTSGASSPEEEYVTREALDKLIKTIQSLNPEDRSLIILRDYLGFKYKEVSKILDVPVGTVKSRVYHVRVKIRSLIGDFNDQ